MSLGLRIDQKGLKIQIARLDKLQKGVAQQRRKLHQRWGILTLQWIDRQFMTRGAHGGAPWRSLSPNTIIGRRKGSSVPLQDTGELRGSFTSKPSARSVRVGTEKRYAPFHEFGTRPYSIVPVRAKVLAFPHTAGRPLKAGVTFPSAERKFPRGTPIIYSKGVRHPGLPARKIMPRINRILPILVRAGERFIPELEARGG